MKNYVQLSKAWYAEANFKMDDSLSEELQIKFSDETSEFLIRWSVLKGLGYEDKTPYSPGI